MHDQLYLINILENLGNKSYANYIAIYYSISASFLQDFPWHDKLNSQIL